MKSVTLIAALALMLAGSLAFGQTASIKGFVYESGSGQTVPMASVTLEGTKFGQATDVNGYFLLAKLPAGPFDLRVSFLGFSDYRTHLELAPDEVRSLIIVLEPSTIELKEATITAERQRLAGINPASVHRLTPVALNRIPGLSGQADLAEYLQVIPGIIFTGDRGGQFYVRGGEPVNNLVKLDGMTIVSPFHSVGFTSVFDTQTISSVDVSTAGFGAQYGGRLSSVIDVKTRAGNRKEFCADGSLNTFGYSLIAEGPLKKMTPENPGSVSFLLSNKGSWIRTTGPMLYPYLDSTGLPFRYDDYFAKVSFIGSKGDQVDIIGTRFSDVADYPGLMRSAWTSTAGGARLLVSPSGSRVLFESSAFVSDFRASLTQPDIKPRQTFYNSAEASFKVHYRGPLFSLLWGTEMNVIHTLHTFQGIKGILMEDEYFTTELLSYLETKIAAGNFMIEPGFRIHYYADKSDLRGEPRLKVRYSVSDRINLNFAGGFYSQNLVSTTSTEDVVNLFQGYYIGPFWIQSDFKGDHIDNKIQLAGHAVLGASYLGPGSLKLTAELYVKDYYRMISYNRNKIYEDVLRVKDDNGGYGTRGYLTKYFIFEKGLAYGLDLMADWSGRYYTVYIAYSLGYVTRQDELITYVPHFDRRHNLNVVGGFRFGRSHAWSAKARWNLGSGFPFTQSVGLYEDLSLLANNFMMDPLMSGELGVWYAPINEGRLPWYHRLDLSLERTWKLSRKMELQAVFGLMNAYNRQNVFYMDRTTYDRIDQLPVLPTLGLSLKL